MQNLSKKLSTQGHTPEDTSIGYTYYVMIKLLDRISSPEAYEIDRIIREWLAGTKKHPRYAIKSIANTICLCTSPAQGYELNFKKTAGRTKTLKRYT